MSFILDALRKVDHENRQSGELLPPVVAVEKLKKERDHRRHQFVAMAVIAVSSAAATAVLLRRPPVPEPVQPKAPAHQAAVEFAADSPVVQTELPGTDVVVPARAPDPPLPAERAAPPEREMPAPVTPAPKPRPGPPQLVLQGTSVLDGKPVAVVSDRRVFEGDIIDGAVVIRIGERTVELEFEGQRFTLTL